MTTLKYIQSEYPLHWAVWNDDHKELQELIKTNEVSFNFCILEIIFPLSRPHFIDIRFIAPIPPAQMVERTNKA